MSRHTRRKLILTTAAIIALALVVLINFTDVCNLQAVTLNGRDLPDWRDRYSLSADKVVFRQPLASVSQDLLSCDSIVRVDFDYDLPGTLKIRTNAFEPACYVVDRTSGRLRGLNRQGRIIRLGQDGLTWDHPVLTSVDAAKLYTFCTDSRVRLLLPQLARLMDDNRELYRTIEEIDFQSEDYLTVSVSGLPYRLLVTAGSFEDQMNEFVRFLEQFETNQAETKTLDLRNDNMIVARGAR